MQSWGSWRLKCILSGVGMHRGDHFSSLNTIYSTHAKRYQIPFRTIDPLTDAVRNNLSASVDLEERLRTARTAGSRTGVKPHSKSKSPPNFLGMFSMSMKAVSVGRTSLAERMNIFEVVIGSNHFLIQPQTVGKNEGAPMI